MLYPWFGLDNSFKKLNLNIENVIYDIIDNNTYMLDTEILQGNPGKTCWYTCLKHSHIERFGLPLGKYGLKVIKYPVYNDIFDEYYRLLQEFSIQKILYKNSMAPNIHKLFLIRNQQDINIYIDWLGCEVTYPKNSIFFAQIVDHIDSDSCGIEGVHTNSTGVLYGKEIDRFINKCKSLRIVPYDINHENVLIENKQLRVIDIHKWRRSYSLMPPHIPQYLQIELNNICNAKCSMCNIPHMHREKGYMSDNLFIKIVKEAGELGIKHITPFLHGEPFLRKDFIDKLKLINKYAPKAQITIFTNASLLSVALLKKLAVIKNIEQLVFSFPGGNKNCYEKITGLNFETTKRNITDAFRILKNVPMRISMPKCEDNEESEKDFFELWKGYPCSSYNTYNYLGNVKGTLCEPAYEQCDRAFRSMTVLFDGRICLCCMDSNGDYILGDISKEKIIDVWNNEKYNELRRLHGICRLAYHPCDMCTLDLKTEEYIKGV